MIEKILVERLAKYQAMQDKLEKDLNIHQDPYTFAAAIISDDPKYAELQACQAVTYELRHIIHLSEMFKKDCPKYDSKIGKIFLSENDQENIARQILTQYGNTNGSAIEVNLNDKKARVFCDFDLDSGFIICECHDYSDFKITGEFKKTNTNKILFRFYFGAAHTEYIFDDIKNSKLDQLRSV